ncbi:hypothetical protein WG902_20730 [Ramlibacter sp. PS3R-8]|uniref:hypothetical protein n=1 Tax=Ramlibacter sp. PS3R-8 TaxID=3133437 RepID=UPI00309672E0
MNDPEDQPEESQSTNDFADDLDIKPQTVHKRYCSTGSYFGIRPLFKLPNGHLRWPKNPLAILKKTGVKARRKKASAPIDDASWPEA